MKTGDIVSGAALAGLGVFIIVEARGWEYLGPDGPGPGFFPLWYGIALLVLSLLLIGWSVRRGAAPESVGRVNWRDVGRALTAWAAFTACIALLKVLGFLLSFGLMTLFVVAAMYRRPLKVALPVAAGTALGFYLVFPLALNVSLPVGVLGF
jgi:putative tricarboxylic transport membrane protein